MSREDLEKKVDLAFLAAFYGGLLTEKQRQVLSLHCEEDLSLGEIAQEVGISRQAVHETLARASARLREMEGALGVAGRFGLGGALFRTVAPLPDRRVDLVDDRAGVDGRSFFHSLEPFRF